MSPSTADRHKPSQHTHRRSRSNPTQQRRGTSVHRAHLATIAWPVEAEATEAIGAGRYERSDIGRRFTTLRRDKLSKGVLAAMLRQLDIDGKEF